MKNIDICPLSVPNKHTTLFSRPCNVHNAQRTLDRRPNNVLSNRGWTMYVIFQENKSPRNNPNVNFKVYYLTDVFWMLSGSFKKKTLSNTKYIRLSLNGNPNKVELSLSGTVFLSPSTLNSTKKISDEWYLFGPLTIWLEENIFWKII